MARKRRRSGGKPKPQPLFSAARETAPPERGGASWRLHLALCAALLLITLLSYWPALDNDFVNYDDDDYVTENPVVQQGIRAETLRWAFTTTQAANWHPLTWVSHLIDVELYGVDPRGHHLSSVLLHLVNTLLLYLVLARWTGAPLRSALVAALFAVHPLHVESVAWIAERKDVLSGLFWMLAMGAYGRYVERPGIARSVAVALLLGLGLMAKPMLVSFPVVLLLLDVWPLERRTAPAGRILEKIPLFALAAASAVATVVAQGRGEAITSLEAHSLGVRWSNAAVSYADYLGKMFWPADLAVFYPHPGASLSGWRVAASVALLVALSAAAIRLRRSRPYLAVGWFWFLVTMLPVIGIVQVGGQAMADRYTYLPYIGLFAALVWGAHDLLRGMTASGGRARASLAAALLVALLPLSLLVWRTRVQVEHWRDTITLFEHTLEVTGNNAVARVNLAEYLGQQGRPEEALTHLKKALELGTNYQLQYNVGIALHRMGRHAEAEPYFLRALAESPDLAEAHVYLGAGLMERRRFDEAFNRFAHAASVDPEHADAHFNMGVARAARQRWPEAITHYRRALELRPGFALAHFDLSVALYNTGDRESAMEQLRLAERFGHAVPPGLKERLRSDLAGSD